MHVRPLLCLYLIILQHADLERFPRLQHVLVGLLFAPEDEDESVSSMSDGSSSPMVKATPRERYHTLPPEDKVAILWFMVNLAVSSKAVHAQIEASEEQLTSLRKEKIELGRSKKLLLVHSLFLLPCY